MMHWVIKEAEKDYQMASGISEKVESSDNFDAQQSSVMVINWINWRYTWGLCNWWI